MFGFKGIKEQVASRFEIGGIAGAAYTLTGRHDCLLAMKICYHAVKRSNPALIFLGNIWKYLGPHKDSLNDDQQTRLTDLKNYFLGSDPDGFPFLKANQALLNESPSMARAIKKCDVNVALAETGIEVS